MLLFPIKFATPGKIAEVKTPIRPRSLRKFTVYVERVASTKESLCIVSIKLPIFARQNGPKLMISNVFYQDAAPYCLICQTSGLLYLFFFTCYFFYMLSLGAEAQLPTTLAVG